MLNSNKNYIFTILDRETTGEKPNNAPNGSDKYIGKPVKDHFFGWTKQGTTYDFINPYF